MRVLDSAPPEFIVPVARLANYLTRKIAADGKLRRIGVSGEISGLSVQPNGTVYFDLKDRDALIKCVGWSEAAASFPPLANGAAVVAVGSVGVYPKKTTLQLTVYAVELEGAGRLHARYEALKRRLDAEGLFAPDRKRPLPAYPFRIALVSSRSANGAGDFLRQAGERAPHVVVEVFETPVQGEAAAPEIVRAIDRASRADVDLVVLARGGGSYEDLFVFNDERIVRALARCRHPTVSAIGHAIDTPLTDFVADRFAATPSTAAQTCLPLRAALLDAVGVARTRLGRSAARHIDRWRRSVQQVEHRSPLAAPERLLAPRRQATDAAADDLRGAVAAQLAAKAQRLGSARARLEACNPSVRLGLRRERLAAVDHRLAQLLHARLHADARALTALEQRLGAANPSLRLSRERERFGLARFALLRGFGDAAGRARRRLDAAASRLAPLARAAVGRRTNELRLLDAMLDGRDPTRILERGYAIVTQAGVILRDAGSVAPGSHITAQLARGTLTARVEPVGADGGE